MTRTPPTPTCRTEPDGYTLEAAVRALPLIRAIAQDAHAAYARLRDGLAALNDLNALEELTSDQSLPRAVRGDLGTLRDYVLELEELGARIEDPELGIVSLSGRLGDKRVRFCWEIGDETITRWYGAHESHERRRPIEPSAT